VYSESLPTLSFPAMYSAVNRHPPVAFAVHRSSRQCIPYFSGVRYMERVDIRNRVGALALAALLAGAGTALAQQRP